MWHPAELRVLLLMSGEACSVEYTKKQQRSKANPNKKQQGIQRTLLHCSFFSVSKLYAMSS